MFPVRVDFLGTGAGNFRGSRRTPSSTLFGPLLLDCGAGATGRLYDVDRFGEVDGVLISHLHSDHIAGLFDFLLHTLISGRKRPLTLVSPPGLGEILRAAFAVKSTVVEPGEIYPFRLIEAERVDVEIAGWRVQSVPLDHTVVNHGYLLTSENVTAFYSGDTREPSVARTLQADYVIHEATFSETHADLARRFGHSTGAQAAETAASMHARQLWINHVGDEPNAENEIGAEARRAFPDSVVVEDRASFRI